MNTDLKKMSLEEKIATLDEFVNSSHWQTFQSLLKDAEGLVLNKILTCNNDELVRWRSELRVIRDIANRPKIWLQMLLKERELDNKQNKVNNVNTTFSLPNGVKLGESFPQGSVLT